MCFEKAAAGKPVFEGFAPNTRDSFTASLGNWIRDETASLDALEYGSLLAASDATHRCRVCVGVYLALRALDHGAIDVPKQVIKQFWKLANEMSDHYFVNLRERAPAPFSKAVREKLGEAFENAV